MNIVDHVAASLGVVTGFFIIPIALFAFGFVLHKFNGKKVGVLGSRHCLNTTIAAGYFSVSNAINSDLISMILKKMSYTYPHVL
jgi:hypothetical protein